MLKESLKSMVINEDLVGLTLLLSDDENPVAKEDLNNSFILSSSLGHIDIAKKLLSEGAEINARMPLGDTALTWAIIKNKVDAITFLIKHGVNINAQTISGNTPLILATQQGKEDVVRQLIRAGAALEKQNKNGQTALMVAEQGSNHRVTELLLSVTNLDAPLQISQP